MNREEILKASRKEHKNRDFSELEVMYQAGSHGARVGALMCCILSLLSSMIAKMLLYCPWAIYFSMMGTQWTVRFIKQRRKSDLLLAFMFWILTVLAFVGVVQRLLEVAA